MLPSLVGRLGIAFFAAVLVRYPAWLGFESAADLQHIRLLEPPYTVLCNWDCGAYGSLAERPTPDAFFPLFPLLSHLLVLLSGLTGRLAVLVLSNVFAVVAGVLVLFLGDLIRAELSPKAASSRSLGFSPFSWFLFLAVTLFPHSHFWLRGYPEPLFFSLIAGALIFLLKGRLLPASLLIGLSAVTRPQGIWVLGAFGLVVLWMSARKRLTLGKTLSLILTAGTPFVLFLIWNDAVTGNFLFFLKAQSGWDRHFSIGSGLRSHLPKFEDSYFYLLLSLGAAFWFLKRSKSGETGAVTLFLGILTVLMAEVPLFMGGFYSYTRFMSTQLGIFVLLAVIFEKRPFLAAPWLIWSVTRLVGAAYSVTFGNWTG